MREFFYTLFFPHPKNNHKAHLLSSKAIFGLAIFFLLSTFIFSPISASLRNNVSADVSTNELLNLTNEKRSENNLKPLKNNDQLMAAATKKAQDMFEKDYWSHNSPDGMTPWVFIKGAGYEYVYAGENLARGFNNATDVVSAWMASPSHRENLLSPNYDDVGFAVRAGKLGGEETILVVQEFGSRNPNALLNTQPEVKGETQGITLAPLIASINNFSFSDNLAMLILLGLILLLVLDIFMIEEKKIVRFAGHNEDHIIFITGIIIVLFILATGLIL